MPTVRKVTPAPASAPAKPAGQVQQREQQIALLVQRNDTAGLVEQAVTSLRITYQVQPHGLKWRVRLDNADPVVMDTPALLSLAGGLDPALAALIAERAAEAAKSAPTAPASIPDAAVPAPILVPLTKIDDNPYQPRLVYDDQRIGAIAVSIQEHGLLQVPLARLMPDGRYQLAFGHSRLRAFRKLSAVIPSDIERWFRMPLIVRELDDETMALHAWIENRDRKDLTCYEEAKAIERYTATFGWTQQQAAAKLQLDRSTVANKLRLLKLPVSALAQLRDGKISERQAMALLPLTELPEPAQKARKVWVSHGGVGYVDGAEELMSKAASLDSNTLRSAVDQYLGQLTIALAGLPWRTQAWEISSVHAARCADCPIRLKSSDRCPDKECAGRKAAAWQQKQAAKAAEKEGLPTTTHRAYNDRDDLGGVQLSAIRKVAEEKGCGNLAVVFDDDRSYYPHKAGGQQHCWIVCGHGPGKRCGCKQALARRADPATGADAKKRHDRQRIKVELVAPAEQAAAAALAQPTVAVWRRLFQAVNSHAASKLPADADIPAIQAALAALLVSDAVRYNLEYSVDYGQARSSLAKLIKDLGAPVPWEATTPTADVCVQTPATDPLAAIRDRLGLLSLQIEGVVKTPEPDLIATYRERLAELVDDLDALADDHAIDDAAYEDLARRIGGAQQALINLDKAAAAPALESEVAG